MCLLCTDTAYQNEVRKRIEIVWKVKHIDKIIPLETITKKIRVLETSFNPYSQKHLVKCEGLPDFCQNGTLPNGIYWQGELYQLLSHNSDYNYTYYARQ